LSEVFNINENLAINVRTALVADVSVGARQNLRCRINAAFRSQVERRIYAAERAWGPEEI